MRFLSCLLLSACVSLPFVPATNAADAKEEGFTKLFNGKDLAGLKLHGLKDDTFKVANEELRCSGKPNGYFYTEKSYKNYTLRFDLKYVRPADLTDDSKFKGNSGFLIHIEGEHKVWPKCVEVQGMNANLGDVLFIGGLKPGTKSKDAEAQKKAIKPVGEWNAIEIICKDDAITCNVNGVKVAEGKSELKQGPIGWQSEGAEIHFRNIRIKEAK